MEWEEGIYIYGNWLHQQLCATPTMLSASQLSKRTLRMAKRGRVLHRGYSQNTTPPPSIKTHFSQEEPKKPFSVAGFLFKVSLLTAAVYGTAATAALIYEPLQDPYLEYFPYGEEVMDKIDYTWKHRKEIMQFDYKKYYNTKHDEFATSFNKTAEKLGIDEYVSIPHNGVGASSLSAQEELKSKEQEKKDKFLVLSNSDLPPKEEKKNDTDALAQTPLLNEAKSVIPKIKIDTADPNITAIISSVNTLIDELNSTKVGENTPKLIDQIHIGLAKLSSSFNPEDVNDAISGNLQYLKDKFEQDKTALVQQLTSTAEETKKALEAKHKESLEKELAEIKKTLELEYENRLKKTEIELVEKFNASVSEKIETERNNKLKNLEALETRINAIENFELELSKVATSYTTFKEIRKTLSKVRSLLVSNTVSDVRGENLVAEFDRLRELTEPLDNKLIAATLNSLPSNKELLVNGGVLTQSQILSRWELLVPQLRANSLLPENPGILGYAASAVFSKFLWSKSGVPIRTEDQLIGNDVESVIARVNSYLHKNQLDYAVEEVASLKGIPRQLANDWIVETRRKLEIQFLVDLLSAEVDVSA